MTLGSWTAAHAKVREQLGSLPGDPILVDFAPQLELLDRAALLVTHAGVNTVLEALERGVPMVALPRSVDQLGMGSRIEHTGVGLRASFQHCRPQELRGLIERVLAEDQFRRNARRLQQAMIAAGGAERAAEITEEALTTRRPVLRQGHGESVVGCL
jgi:zeaxanthin glucosyltransferase